MQENCLKSIPKYPRNNRMKMEHNQGNDKIFNQNYITINWVINAKIFIQKLKLSDTFISGVLSILKGIHNKIQWIKRKKNRRKFIHALRMIFRWSKLYLCWWWKFNCYAGGTNEFLLSVFICIPLCSNCVRYNLMIVTLAKDLLPDGSWYCASM